MRSVLVLVDDSGRRFGTIGGALRFAFEKYEKVRVRLTFVNPFNERYYDLMRADKIEDSFDYQGLTSDFYTTSCVSALVSPLFGELKYRETFGCEYRLEVE